MVKNSMSKKSQVQSAFVQAIREAYGQGQEDEALEPLVAVDEQGRPLGRVQKGDVVIFYDLRGEREIELTQALTDEEFHYFPVESLDLSMVTMIEYASRLKVKVAFPPEGPVNNTLTELFSKAEVGAFQEG